MRVLIVEDDIKLAALIQRALREQAALADAAHDGEDALWMAGATPYDVMVLDINLPGINGFETCQQLRASRVATPILMLTARAAVDDKVRGLDTGADDYLVKPFDVSEMLARVRALARRGPGAPRAVVSASVTSASIRAHGSSAGGIRRSRCLRRSSSCSRSSCAGQGRSYPATTCWRGPGTWRMRTDRTLSTSTSATCGTRSIAHSGSGPSRPSAVPGTG
jgi:DNA-binding response OmpR family regulator